MTGQFHRPSNIAAPLSAPPRPPTRLKTEARLENPCSPATRSGEHDPDPNSLLRIEGERIDEILRQGAALDRPSKSRRFESCRARQ